MGPTISMTDDTLWLNNNPLLPLCACPLSCQLAPATEHLQSQTTPKCARQHANRELPPRMSGGTVNDPKGIGLVGVKGRH